MYAMFNSYFQRKYARQIVLAINWKHAWLNGHNAGMQIADLIFTIKHVLNLHVVFKYKIWVITTA